MSVIIFSLISCVFVNKVQVANAINNEEVEQEEMWVEPDPSIGIPNSLKEHGGPRRGGRFMEPTRFGDWERKGRCTDF